MHRIALVCVGLIAATVFVPSRGMAWAQDIAGTEDCTKTSGLDKRTGCMQSNVNFLQQLVTKNALDARQRLNAANGEVAALKAEIVALKSAVTSLQASVQQLQAAQKTAADKKPDGKPETNKPETNKSETNKPETKKPDAK